jgi:hypothetical protein
MYLVRLIYTSRISASFEQADMAQILDSARKFNRTNHITGLLYFNRKMFLQCLEGPRETVNLAYAKIMNDTRHEELNLLAFSEISERLFADWSMGYVPENKVTDGINLKYSTNPNFNPMLLSGDSALNLMISLKTFMAGETG